MSRRGYIPHKEELAAALAQLAGIPHEHRKQMTAEQVRSLFHRDHKPILKDYGGPDLHWNLQWTLIRDHREVTKTDVREIRKGDRISAEHEAFRARLLAKTGRAEAPEKPKSRLGSRKLQSRPMRSARRKDGHHA